MCRSKTRTTLQSTGFAVLILLAIATPVAGQWELGADAAIARVSHGESDGESPSHWESELPVLGIRLGRWFSDRASVELTTSLQGTDGITVSDVRLFGYVHQRALPVGTGFARAGVGLQRVSADFLGEASNRFGFGGGIGYKAPVAQSLLLRFEGGVFRWTDGDDSIPMTRLYASFGFSWFNAGIQ